MGFLSKIWSKKEPPEVVVPQEGFDGSDRVTIGLQVWTSRNLNVGTFRNGDLIPEARTTEEWLAAGDNEQPAWCYYNNDPQLGLVYGRLYNWFAVVDKRGLVPKWWHIPNNWEYDPLEKREFSTLISVLGGSNFAGTKLKEAGVSKWMPPNNVDADNASGFTALPGGIRFKEEFADLGRKGYWWTATANGDDHAYLLSLQTGSGGALTEYTSKTHGLSVRCIKG